MPDLKRWIVIAAAILLVLTIAKSFHYANKFGGTDLRNRVVNARILHADKSPYFYKWNPDDGEWLLDPNDHNRRHINGNTITPAGLKILYPFYSLPYKTVRFLWATLEILLALGSILLIAKRTGPNLNMSSVGLIIIGLVCSNQLLLEIERGQMYLLYTFLWTSIYFLYTSPHKNGQLLSGVLTAIFMFMRPFAGIIIVPFLITGNKRWLSGFFTGATAGVLVFVLPNLPYWSEYFLAMREFADIYLGTHPNVPIGPEVQKPEIIEGLTNLSTCLNLDISAIKPIYFYLEKMGIRIDQFIGWLIYGTVVGLLSFAFYKRRKETTTTSIFLFAFTLYILAECFTAAPRGSYNVNQWIFPLSLIFLSGLTTPKTNLLLVTGILLLHNYPFIIPYQGGVGECIFLGSVIFYAFRFINRSPQSLPEATS
jgi:hypothetical protein